METNFDEGISDEVLRGSFLALKQLQTKGKKVAKLKKSPSTIKAETGPRSKLYAQFKELHGFGKVSPEPLDTPVPKSLLMYRTYKEIFDQKNKKIRYTDETKPDHPFFGRNTVLAEEFTHQETQGFSNIYNEVVEEMELEGLITKYNYNLYPAHEVQCAKKIRTPIVKPLKKSTKTVADEDSGLTEEFLRSLQQPVVDSDSDGGSVANSKI